MEILIASLSLLVSIWLAVYAWYNNHRVKKLENDLDIQKNKSLLNDKKTREVFEKFIQLYMDMLFNKKSIKSNEIEKVMIDIKKTLLINWSWKLVNEFNDFILFSKQETINENWINLDMFNSFEKFTRLFRTEIWVNNKWLSKYSILQLFLREDVNTIIK